VNIEVQLRNVGNMNKRSLFYWSKEYVRGIDAGQDYEELPKVIAINIVDFEFMEFNEFHTSFHLCEDNHKDVMLTDAQEIHFISMSAFRKEKAIDIENNALHRWLAFFDRRTNKKTLEKIIKMDTGIAKAQEKILFVSQDKETLRACQMREMAMSDYTSGIYHARRDGERRGIVIGVQLGNQLGKQIGKQQGITIGKKKAQAEYVLKLFQKGLSIKEIAEWTDLPVEEVTGILK
jgi:predicted transposase/invertase (TIGR01784 family)